MNYKKFKGKLNNNNKEIKNNIFPNEKYCNIATRATIVMKPEREKRYYCKI